MTPEEAEAVLALDAEVATALEFAHDRTAFDADWRLRLAAERIVERVFQAAQGLDDDRRAQYFGGEGFRALRGMRNRLAHNYLDVDEDILWDAIAVDLPEVHDRLALDVALARATLAPLVPGEAADSEQWRRKHLGPTEPAP